MINAGIFDARRCELGEGPLWHPGRGQLFWFDIRGRRLLSQRDGVELEWRFAENVSAAGWIDDDHLLIASETELFRFNLDTGTRDTLAVLEADDPATRSNDGRADPWGGFWIGTMGKRGEAGRGAIYRFYRGELRRLHARISISNAICFSPDRQFAYFCDTPTRRILRQALADADGWPSGEPDVFVDLAAEGLNPDGAVVDTEGYLWNAQWGAARVARYAPSGEFVDAVAFAAMQTSCPAFGGADFDRLFVTSAAEDLSAAGEADGCTLVATVSATGQAEHRVIL